MNGINQAYLCAATMAHVDEFIDGELSPHECEGVEAHLLGCPGCRSAFQRELDLKNLVRRACVCSDVPPDLKAAVLTRIQQLRIDVEHARFESLTITVRRTVGGSGGPAGASGVTGSSPGPLE